MIGLKVFATALIVFVICVVATPQPAHKINTVIAFVGLLSLATMIFGMLMVIWY